MRLHPRPVSLGIGDQWQHNISYPNDARTSKAIELLSSAKRFYDIITLKLENTIIANYNIIPFFFFQEIEVLFYFWQSLVRVAYVS